MTMPRRRVLLGTAAAVISAPTLPTPAIAQGRREFTLVTSWDENQPGWWQSAVRLADLVAAMSDGRLRIKVHRANDLVGAFEVFDAVSAGVADMYHSDDAYFPQRSPALYFFGAVPYGMTADEFSAWIAFGGGQALWDEAGARFNLKPLASCSSGVQMGGWFNKEVAVADDFKGLRYRMPEPGAEVLRRMGATVVTIPGSDIATALKSGAIDPSEWVGPWMDITLGLHKVADYYYYPGFHEPGTNLTLGISKNLWDGLPPPDRALIETAAAADFTRSLAQFNAENVKALKMLRADSRIKIRRFNDELIKAFGKFSKEVMAEIADKDPLTRRVYDSYTAFLAGMMEWGELSETGYRDTRRLALG